MLNIITPIESLGLGDVKMPVEYNEYGLNKWLKSPATEWEKDNDDITCYLHCLLVPSDNS